ncbi:YbaB/EbfC family nucleoid-associated protein [Kribbella sp. CA-247076]|uniref:YbaB/EbfC family nucleoid-associated protein n=1 Tax=Kribbella sp. CA-247076 TaxID=3239941 RepID=UPI003D8BD7B1
MNLRAGSDTGDQAQVGRLAELERETHRIRDSVAGTTGSAESPDGLVEATVGVYGELVELILDPRVFRTPDADALAEQIRSVVNEARAAAQDGVRRDLAKYLAADADGPAGLAFQPFTRLLGGGR